MYLHRADGPLALTRGRCAQRGAPRAQHPRCCGRVHPAGRPGAASGRSMYAAHHLKVPTSKTFDRSSRLLISLKLSIFHVNFPYRASGPRPAGGGRGRPGIGVRPRKAVPGRQPPALRGANPADASGGRPRPRGMPRGNGRSRAGTRTAVVIIRPRTRVLKIQRPAACAPLAVAGAIRRRRQRPVRHAVGHMARLLAVPRSLAAPRVAAGGTINSGVTAAPHRAGASTAQRGARRKQPCPRARARGSSQRAEEEALPFPCAFPPAFSFSLLPFIFPNHTQRKGGRGGGSGGSEAAPVCLFKQSLCSLCILLLFKSNTFLPHNTSSKTCRRLRRGSREGRPNQTRAWSRRLMPPRRRRSMVSLPCPCSRRSRPAELPLREPRLSGERRALL